MKLLTEVTTTKWDKKIQLELTLRELQIIRDSIGATSHCMRSEYWDDDFKDCPYNSEQGSSLFDDVNYILEEQGGVTFE